MYRLAGLVFVVPAVSGPIPIEWRGVFLGSAQWLVHRSSSQQVCVLDTLIRIRIPPGAQKICLSEAFNTNTQDTGDIVDVEAAVCSAGEIRLHSWSLTRSPRPSLADTRLHLLQAYGHVAIRGCISIRFCCMRSRRGADRRSRALRFVSWLLFLCASLAVLFGAHARTKATYIYQSQAEHGCYALHEQREHRMGLRAMHAMFSYSSGV